MQKNGNFVRNSYKPVWTKHFLCNGRGSASVIMWHGERFHLEVTSSCGNGKWSVTVVHTIMRFFFFYINISILESMRQNKFSCLCTRVELNLPYYVLLLWCSYGLSTSLTVADVVLQYKVCFIWEVMSTLVYTLQFLFDWHVDVNNVIFLWSF